MTRIIRELAEVAQGYDTLFCDLWGCVHDGYSPYPEAVAALRRFREGGGTVLLLTNAPRPRAAVARHLDRLGLPRACWDVIATSGDSARAALFRGVVGQKVWFMGEPHDLTFFDPADTVPDPLPIERVPLAEAEGIVCTGPFDPHQPPEVLRPQLLEARVRGLKLLCANPDIVVDRGGVREYCAGAVAALYTRMGGESLYFGKPHPPIYDLARLRLQEVARARAAPRILAIGDGLHTDIEGAIGEDLDCLFITGGLAARDTATPPGGQPDPQRLAALLAREMLEPTLAMGFLR